MPASFDDTQPARPYRADRFENKIIRRDDIECWIFDLDNTLYKADVNFFGQIDLKITEYISQYLGVDPVEARRVQKEYLIDYGTSLSGLMAVDGMDPVEFLDFVHDVDLALLRPDPCLRTAIAALPGRKLIYTNGSRKHARNIAGHLNLLDLFDGAHGVEDGDYIPKPKREAYERFNARFNVDPSRAIFFEDNVRNLEVPCAMGMRTVLITSDVDWRHEPEQTRPGGAGDNGTQPSWPDYVDVVTADLPQWLSALGSR